MRQPRKAFRLEWQPHLDEAQFHSFKTLCSSQGHSMAWVLCRMIVAYCKGQIVIKTHKEVQ